MVQLAPHAKYSEQLNEIDFKIADITDIIAWYKFEPKDAKTLYALENHINFYLTKHKAVDCENVQVTKIKASYKTIDNYLGLTIVGYNGDICLGTVLQEYPGGSIFSNYSLVGE